jgi:hypothetical protein
MATTTMTAKNRTLLTGAMRDGVSSVVACVGSYSLFVWLVGVGWFVLREMYCWLVGVS